MTQAVVIIGTLVLLASLALVPFALALFLAETALSRLASLPASLLFLLVRSLRRNRMRTSLTFIATFVLVFVVGGLWSVLYYLDQFLTDQARSPRVVVSEKWQLTSQMPLNYAASLSAGAARQPEDVRPTDSMTWQLYIGTTEPANPSPDNTVVCIAMEPVKVLTMFDDIFTEMNTDRGNHRNQGTTRRRQLLEESVEKLQRNKRGILLGARRLVALNKRVGERINLAGMQFRNIDLELEIVGVLAGGRYSDLGVIQRDYLNDSFDSYARKFGYKHPMESKSLTMVWLQLADQPGCARVAEQIDASGLFQSPAVKCQTISAEVAAALDAYADLIWGLRWVLSPAVLVIMTLVMANAIGIGVRERAPEIAVLKVIGFRAWQVLLMVLGEPMLIGALAGLLSALCSRVLVNQLLNQYSDNPIDIDIPMAVLWWCPGAGLLTGLAGSVAPAWSACRLKAAQVFARSI
jgi:putative ABC transport system permease protein